MCNIIKLKIMRGTEEVMESEGSISIQDCYSKKFESYINKKGKGCRVFVRIPDENGDKELDITYQDIFPTKDKAIEEGEKFLQEWLGEVRVSYL